ncbi:MAG: zeta toxin family protein [Pyrinomonadaceae bacterium MAG19_C2-C3]|nr:zeta toxin family protein [Pyrinomonadaceae bacterium MAG19_C2-C3]
MPNVILISGANGAGKSTLAPHLLRDTFGVLEYVNADTIALGLSAFAPEQAAYGAGRIMLKRLDELAAGGKDFAFETTLASRSYVRRLKRLQEVRGYKVSLIFLWLGNADLAVSRVSERVKIGGHDVPEAVIRRRYVKGLRNFFELYQPLADAWRVYDVSSSIPKPIASGTANQFQVTEHRLWKQMQMASK